MLVQITSQCESQYSKSVELSNGKTSICVSIDRSDGWVQVICQNAAHRVWRGAGRFFPSFEAALAGYKSASVRSLIQAAEIELAGGQ
jgi:hypothetical protein